ncbi:hypothetical protein Acife_1997 [Acidithiobacillus ferrivorans SS3]|uniref:Uncharacterized protein n=1 Tax=Acidithiobacillus ferrivorans SS3 TaxID=743299 RepID=G0JM67_9PROT|nr:hypothetical protein [Acidithiobacillus ferrivorans]AEM48117.1 hypothetical protein Acife_1997 [Acidithiobacillus ferrivorans SS3]
MPTLGDTFSRHILTEEPNQPREEREEMDWPSLTGSAKQVPWATDIRKFRIDQARHNQITSREQDIMEFLRNIRSAHWWIETRSLPHTVFTQSALDQFAKCRYLAPPKTDMVADMALAEATLVPPALRGPVTEVSISSNTVMVLLIEFDADVNKLLKRFRFHWEAPAWVRQAWTDVVEHRAIEIAVRLLEYGCPVRIFEEALRLRVIEHDYEPEPTRRIEISRSDKYSAKFHLVWALDEDMTGCERAARQLRGAKVFNDGAYISPSHYEDVQDFADQNGFAIMPDAREMITNEQQKLVKAVKVVAKPRKKAAVAIQKKSVLAPVTGMIDAELADE